MSPETMFGRLLGNILRQKLGNINLKLVKSYLQD